MATKKSEITCDGCGKTFLKETRYIKAAIKHNRKNFCDLSCHMTYKNKTDERFKPRPGNLWRGGQPDKYSPFRYHYRKTYQRKNKTCGITLEDVYELWYKQEGKCAITGIDMTLDLGLPHSASLDRIDSNQGYTKDNCQFVCFSMNMAKHKFTTEQFNQFMEKLL